MSQNPWPKLGKTWSQNQHPRWPQCHLTTSSVNWDKVPLEIHSVAWDQDPKPNPHGRHLWWKRTSLQGFNGGERKEGGKQKSVCLTVKWWIFLNMTLGWLWRLNATHLKFCKKDWFGTLPFVSLRIALLLDLRKRTHTFSISQLANFMV